VTNPAREDETLDSTLFVQFFHGISRIKFPLVPDHAERLVEDVAKSNNMSARLDSRNFAKVMDKNVMKVLLKYDMPLRRVFGYFAGANVKVGGGVTWDELKRTNTGMEVK